MNIHLIGSRKLEFSKIDSMERNHKLLMNNNNSSTLSHEQE